MRAQKRYTQSFINMSLFNATANKNQIYCTACNKKYNFVFRFPSNLKYVTNKKLFI